MHIYRTCFRSRSINWFVSINLFKVISSFFYVIITNQHILIDVENSFDVLLSLNNLDYFNQ